MTNRYRFRYNQTIIARIVKPICEFDSQEIWKATTDVTVLNGYRVTARGREKIFYTCKINSPALHPIFGEKVDIQDVGVNLRPIKSRRTRYLKPLK